MPFPSDSLYPAEAIYPGDDVPIVWDAADERYFTTGTDRGVLYPRGKSAVPWNGIIGVTEAGAGETSVLYRDGHIFYTDVEPGDYSGSLTAYFWPDEFSECLGQPEIAPGFFADYQKPKPFDLSYRSLIGSGTRGDMFGYQIHLVYNAIASVNQRTRKTVTNTPAMDEYNFDLVATPVNVKGYRPTAHFIIDTRGMDPEVLTELETQLYITRTFPNANDVYELIEFGSAVHFVDMGDGRIRVSAASTRFETFPDGHIKIKNVLAVDHEDYYTVSDTL